MSAIQELIIESILECMNLVKKYGVIIAIALALGLLLCSCDDSWNKYLSLSQDLESFDLYVGVNGQWMICWHGCKLGQEDKQLLIDNGLKNIEIHLGKDVYFRTDLSENEIIDLFESLEFCFN